MKNKGMNSIVSIVVLIMLLNMLVLMVCWVLVFVFEVSISGVMFSVKVSEVMRMGCNCSIVVLIVVFIRFVFLVCNWCVNLMMRMVFLVESLMMVIMLILKNMLLGMLCRIIVVIVLIKFSGIISMIDSGMC